MIGAPLGWIATNWRLKLLSLVLAVGLLGAVAFSENPPVFDTASVRIEFANPPQDMVVMNPPSALDVPVAGLRDAVTRYKNGAAGVSIDLANAKPGPNQKFAVTPKIGTPGVTVRSRVDPISLTLDRLAPGQLDIEVRTPRTSPGIAVIPEKTYATCGNSNDRCRVSVSAAASIMSSLKAYVDYDVPLTSANTLISPNEPIKFESDGRPIDLKKDVKTIPRPSVTPDNVTVQIQTRSGTLTKTVGLNVRVTGTQACGYAISGVDVQPNSGFVSITGPIDSVARLNTLTLEAVDITGITSSTTVPRRVVTGSPQITADPATVRVTVNVNQSFSCAAPAAAAVVPPSPTPSPSP